MKQTIDLSKEYGIVLEGGGAKGAYQIGVWKALLEYGVKIKGIAGVSVGALNGALICMGDYEKAVDIWQNISYSKIMNIDDNEMDKLISGKLKSLSLQIVRKESKKILISGGFDITPLKELIKESIDEKKIKESEIEFIMGTFSLSNMKEIEISSKEAEEGYLKDYLLASASFPLFKNDKLHGKKYLDGGIVNNVPIDMLLNRGYKDIIVVRIYGPGLEKRVKIPEDVNIIEISPRCNLCNVLEFNKRKAVRNINLGYYDAKRKLDGLAGCYYYIDVKCCEKEYLNRLTVIDDDMIVKLLTAYKQEVVSSERNLRSLLENVYPQIAGTFRLDKNWCYQDLYYALLEYAAKKLKVPRFCIYREEELIEKMDGRLVENEEQEQKVDLFLHLVQSIINQRKNTSQSKLLNYEFGIDNPTKKE